MDQHAEVYPRDAELLGRFFVIVLVDRDELERACFARGQVVPVRRHPRELGPCLARALRVVRLGWLERERTSPRALAVPIHDATAQDPEQVPFERPAPVVSAAEGRRPRRLDHVVDLVGANPTTCVVDQELVQASNRVAVERHASRRRARSDHGEARVATRGEVQSWVCESVTPIPTCRPAVTGRSATKSWSAATARFRKMGPTWANQLRFSRSERA